MEFILWWVKTSQICKMPKSELCHKVKIYFDLNKLNRTSRALEFTFGQSFVSPLINSLLLLKLLHNLKIWTWRTSKRNFITELTLIYNHIARATPPTPSVNHYHFQGVVRMSTVSVREQSETHFTSDLMNFDSADLKL